MSNYEDLRILRNRVTQLECELSTAKIKLEASKADFTDMAVILCDGLVSVLSLIEDSEGVAGLHLSGEIAEWSSLRTGGEFESWLSDFDIAIKHRSELLRGPLKGTT